MGTKMTPATGTAPKAYTVAEMNYWIDRFWDRQIFEPRGIVPDEEERKVSRWLFSRAILSLVNEGVEPSSLTTAMLAQAIQRVSRESNGEELRRFMDEAQA